jgi:predicted kinase
MIRLHPDLSFRTAEYGHQTEIVKDLIWSVAEQVLRSGVDVVLDWNSWSRARRAWAVQRAATIPAQVTLHILDASIEQATTRADQRHHDPHAAYAHSLGREDIEHLASIMEPPSETEGFDIISG